VIRSLLTDHGDLVIEIADQGVGMPYEQLIEANQRLAEPPTVDVSVSRRMGLFVVGRLAQRHGIAVRLGGNEGEPGLTAVVTVPGDLVQAGEYTEFGPRTDQVPAPRTGEQAAQYDAQYDYGTVQLPQQPSWQPQPDDWPAASDWPEADAEPEPRPDQEPTPYRANETAPMQVSMVDSMSGMDLFTPSSVPNLSDNGVDNSADRALREIFGEDYPGGDTQRRAWPDTDQDVYHGYPAPAEPSYPPSDVPDHAVAGQPAQAEARSDAEDHLGVAGQLHEGEETTPIYEEMVSAWFRELSPPAPSAARAAPTYFEPPPFEMPAVRSQFESAPAAGDYAQPAQAGQPAYQAQPDYRAEPVPASAQSGPSGLPRRSDSGSRAGSPPPSRPEPAAPAAGSPPARPVPGTARPDPTVVAGGRGRHAAPAEQPAATLEPAHHEATDAEPRPEHTGSGDVWRSPADEGWLAAEALSNPENNGFTAAGLPKRRRGAHLVPGAAAPPPSPPPTATPRRARSADDVRGRLANYQQGLLQGREFRRGMATASLEHGTEPPVQQGKNEESQ
jgi:hypothetical protein